MNNPPLGFPRLRYTQSSSPHIFVSFLASTHIFLHRLLLAGHSSFSGRFTFCCAMMVRSMVVTKTQAQRVLTNLDVDPRPCVYYVSVIMDRPLYTPSPFFLSIAAIFPWSGLWSFLGSSGWFGMVSLETKERARKGRHEVTLSPV